MPAYLRSAYLRVYQPLSAFGDHERRLLAGAGEGESCRLRLCASVSGVEGLHAVPPEERRALYTRSVDGDVYVCTALPEVRALEHLAAHRSAGPRTASLFSLEQIEGARLELRRIRAELPGIRPSLAQSVWYVPRRWFVCFDDAERRVEHIGVDPVRWTGLILPFGFALFTTS